MKNFFISYTSADQQWAEWIAWQIENAGYSVVIQAWDFRPGSNFVLEMQRAASEAERTLAVLSPNFLAARFTQP
ncbi:MAG: toll/interleukin-1 receptor domain-containing protein, partial [Chloroflexi bacterium]|nr:toll/interleukin-1 receptor domain-containing protein [Chloroflexota bacterium]